MTGEWVAYDENDVIAGSYSNRSFTIIPAGEHYYVGGAGSAFLAGVPDRVELKITNEGLLTANIAPLISVSDVQIISNGYYYEVTAQCETDNDISSLALDGQIIIKDENGQILAAEFWNVNNLPNNLSAGDKFKLSEMFFDLPGIPATTEVFVYYNQGQ